MYGQVRLWDAAADVGMPVPRSAEGPSWDRVAEGPACRPGRLDFSALSAESVEGTLDFFNTARLSGLTASGGTLSSNNSAFQALPGGGYGFLPAVTGVPEPTTWAMLILGFGLIGGALRRRTERTVLA